MLTRIGPREMAILAGVCLLFFGNRLPDVMHYLSRSMRGGSPWAGV